MDVLGTVGTPASALSAGSSSTTTAGSSSSALDVRIDVKGAYIVDAVADEQDAVQDEDYQQDSRDIRLPHQRSVVSHMAMDIGGSLIKLCYWSFEHSAQAPGGRLNFRKFPTDRIDSCIEFIRQLTIKQRLQHTNSQSDDSEETSNSTTDCAVSDDTDTPHPLHVVATGGGAYKFYDTIRAALGVEVTREDEMECLIIGLDFFISQVPNEVFVHVDTPEGTSSSSNSDEGAAAFVPAGEFQHPYLLVNMGSGVSIIKVSGPREFARVGGTSLGGGTLWGLLSLLTGARNFDEMLALAARGDNTAIDMLVGDIYGADYGKVGLKSSTIASSFGKVYRRKRQAERDAEDHGGMADGEFDASTAAAAAATPPGKASTQGASDETARHVSFRPEDVSKSLLYAISNNIGQIAYLHAEKHNCEHIYFGGSFIGGHSQTMATLSYAIKFWSKGSKQAFFLRHEGYLGAVGAFLRRQPVHWGARRGSVEGLFPLSRVGSRN